MQHTHSNVQTGFPDSIRGLFSSNDHLVFSVELKELGIYILVATLFTLENLIILGIHTM